MNVSSEWYFSMFRISSLVLDDKILCKDWRKRWYKVDNLIIVHLSSVAWKSSSCLENIFKLKFCPINLLSILNIKIYFRGALLCFLHIISKVPSTSRINVMSKVAFKLLVCNSGSQSVEVHQFLLYLLIYIYRFTLRLRGWLSKSEISLLIIICLHCFVDNQLQPALQGHPCSRQEY